MISLICVYKTESNKQTYKTNKHEGEEDWGEVEEGKEGQMFGDRRRLDFEW